MRKYNLQQDVHWRRILFMVHWNLERDKRIFERCLQDEHANLYDGNLYQTFRENLEAYRELRQFLRLPATGKLEMEIQELLRKSEELPKKEEA